MSWTSFPVRLVALGILAARVGLSYLYAYKVRRKYLRWPLPDETMSRMHTRNAILIRDAASRFRGGAIKVCQFLSTRLDLLPNEYIEELRKLQDRVPPLPYHLIRDAVEKELGAPLTDKFSDFKEECIGAASLAQVHEAYRKDTGDKVAVKVQYPGLQKSIRADLIVMRASVWVAKHVQDTVRLDGVYDEFAVTLREEIDFTQEGRYSEEVAKHLGDNTTVTTPAIHWDYTTSRLLVMEFKEGVPLTRLEDIQAGGHDLVAIIRSILNIYAEQFFLHGLFSADPHLGNFIIDFDTPNDKFPFTIVLIDFGMMKRLNKRLRDMLRKGFISIFRDDVEEFVKVFIEVSGEQGGDNEEAIRALVDFNFKTFNHLSYNELQRLDYDDIGDDLKAMVAQVKGVRIPVELLLFFRATSLLEGVTQQMAPDSNMLDIVAPHILSFIQRKDPLDEDTVAA